MVESWERGEYLISTDRSRLNVELIHDFLADIVLGDRSHA